MAAVIRLKRRVDEDPLNAFVLNCKRARTSPESQDVSVDESSSSSTSCARPRRVGDSGGEVSTVLKFAGTFEKPDNIATHLAQQQHRLSKEEAREMISSRVHQPEIVNRNRHARRQNAQNSRFRIVNCTRSLDQNEGTTIVDVEREALDESAGEGAESYSVSAVQSLLGATSVEEAREDEDRYVYDLYVAEQEHHPAAEPQSYLSYIPDNLEDIRLVLVEDLYYTFFSII